MLCIEINYRCFVVLDSIWYAGYWILDSNDENARMEEYFERDVKSEVQANGELD